MKVAIILGLCGLYLFSCGGDTANMEENSDSEVPVETIDSSETSAEEETTEVLYSTVEDYCQITSKDQLVSQFGEENLIDGESLYAEGTVRLENSVLTNPENGQVIKYLWEEDGNTLSLLEASYYLFDEDYSILGTQVISSECGVSTGMSLQELREWNGADFDFFGFGWDYEGGIFEDSGSKIAECSVHIKLSFDLEIEIPEEYLGMYSDQLFNTADEITQGAPALINLLTYYPADE